VQRLVLFLRAQSLSFQHNYVRERASRWLSASAEVD